MAGRLGLTIAVMFIVMVVVVPASVWWFRRHPNVSQRYPSRQRMPRFVAVFGWVQLVVGLLMTLVSFGSSDVDDPLAFRIASIAILFGGVLFLAMYANWVIAVERDVVHYRSVLGREDRIVYSDIVDYRMREVNGQPNLRVTAFNGTKFAVNPVAYDVTPLLNAITYKEERGRWPLPGELPG